MFKEEKKIALRIGLMELNARLTLFEICLVVMLVLDVVVNVFRVRAHVGSQSEGVDGEDSRNKTVSGVGVVTHRVLSLAM